METKQEWTGEYIKSLAFSRPEPAWQDFLEQLIEIIRMCPNTYTFGWRKTPECYQEKDFDKTSNDYIVVGRLIINTKGNPIPLPETKWDDGTIKGFGLAQVNDGSP